MERCSRKRYYRYAGLRSRNHKARKRYLNSPRTSYLLVQAAHNQTISLLSSSLRWSSPQTPPKTIQICFVPGAWGVEPPFRALEIATVDVEDGGIDKGRKRRERRKGRGDGLDGIGRVEFLGWRDGEMAREGEGGNEWKTASKRGKPGCENKAKQGLQRDGQ